MQSSVLHPLGVNSCSSVENVFYARHWHCHLLLSTQFRRWLLFIALITFIVRATILGNTTAIQNQFILFCSLRSVDPNIGPSWNERFCVRQCDSPQTHHDPAPSQPPPWPKPRATKQNDHLWHSQALMYCTYCVYIAGLMDMAGPILFLFMCSGECWWG